MGTPAIRRLLRESAGTRIWTARTLYQELEKRGWLSAEAQHPLRGVEAAINRMWKREEIERVGPGRYRLPPQIQEVQNETGSP